jgi:hypothetical protein
MTLGMNMLARASDPSQTNPPELGRVKWGRDFDAALDLSKQSHKPVLLLFQEIPGCQGCKDFGSKPLSHPLLVDAIESEFIPVVIHNNKPGKDEEVLKRFNEPAWNYPVARFVNSDGQDLIPRKDEVFSIEDIASRMIEALAAANRPVPGYLQLAATEARSESDRAHRELATFAMHCFWTGETNLGAIDGVITTRAGFLNDEEVVEVVFDPTIISFAELSKSTDQVHCAAAAYANSETQLADGRKALGDRVRAAKSRAKAAPASDQKYSLSKTALRFLPITPMQATKVNAALAKNADVDALLSPRQIAMLAQINAILARDATALDGFIRPDAIAGLAEYQDRLIAALVKSSS